MDLIGHSVVFPTSPAGQVTLSRDGGSVVIERRIYSSDGFANETPDVVTRVYCPPEALRAILRLFPE
jgi:hypothetical protein